MGQAWQWASVLLVTALATAPASPRAEDEAPPELALPIDCKPGTNCFVQQLVDRDPGPTA